MTIKSSKRWKKLYTTASGNQYFMHLGRRWHLSEFMRLNDSIAGEWHGSMHISNMGGMLIKISNCGEACMTALTY